MPRIFVVDDDPAVQQVWRIALEDAGYLVEVAADGKQALDRLTHEPFDLLLLDVLLPSMDGFRVIEQIRANQDLVELPVVMVSGIYRGAKQRTDMMRRFGVLEYIDKPVNLDSLVSLVQENIGRGDLAQVLKAKGQAGQPPKKEQPPSSPTPESEAVIGQGRPADERLVEPEARLESSKIEEEARTFRTNAFLFQGVIKKKPVPAVLGTLWRGEASGALMLRRRKTKKIIYIENGNPYAVRSNLVSECLGQFLVREGRLSEADCAASVRKMKQSGRPQGEILLAMQALSEKNLGLALQLQLEAKIFRTFAWQSGEFRFNPTAKLPAPHIDFRWGGSALAIEGIRRTFDETRLRGLMIPVLDVPVKWRQNRVFDLDNLGFLDAELDAVRAFDLPKTARQIITAGLLSPPDMLRVIYSLIALELLVP